jgi:autotransporter-associated beta strand protein
MSPRVLSFVSVLMFVAFLPNAWAVVLRYEQTPGTTTGWVTAANIPDDLPEIRGLIVVGNGAGGDETGMVNDAELLAFARAQGFGVMAFGRWSNLYTSTERARFLAALSDFAARANRPELVNVPWVAFGFSQGGGQAYSLNYHFPARTIAIGVNKAGYSFLNGGSDTGRLDQVGTGGRPASPDALKTPALLVAAALDDPGRITNLTDAFNNNRGQGAPWAMLIEENVGHEKGRAYHWMLPFLAEAIALRYPSGQSAAAGQPALADVNQAPGWLIDHSTQSTGQLQVESQASFSGNTSQRLARGWVPSEATARRAQAFGSYLKLSTTTAATTTTSPSGAPLDLVYGMDLSAQTNPAWTKVEFFDGLGKLGELLPAGGATPTWTRRIASSTGFVSTYGLVTRADATSRYTRLQTLWVNGASGFNLPDPATQLVFAAAGGTNSWSSGTNWSGGVVPALAADAWVGLRNTSGSPLTANLDAARTIGYLQNLSGNYIVVHGGTGGSLALATAGGRNAAIQLGGGGTFEFRVSPTGSVPLDLIGNGNPSSPGAVIMNVASGFSGPITARNALRWDMSVSSTAFGTTNSGTAIEAGSVLNFREWPGGTISVPESFTLAGLGQPGLPALRVGTANSSTVTLVGSLTLNGPVALGAASSANGINFNLNGLITSLAAADRSLYLGYLQSQAGDATLPGGLSLNTTALDDSGGVWGATTFGTNVSYPGLAPDRVVLGLGDFRLVGGNNRLPPGARLVFNTATATATPALRQSKLTLAGVSQEVAGLDSFAGTNTSYTIAVVGGATNAASLIVNTPAGLTSLYGGVLGGGGANENNLALEKRGAGTLVLAGSNSYAGSTVVSNGQVELATNGWLRFVIGATGVNNAFTGAGSALFRGSFLFDLAAAGTNTGDAWTIVSVTTPSYDGSFRVSGFTNNASGTWTRVTNGVTYQFVQATGVLSIPGAGPTNAYGQWLTNHPSLTGTNTNATADPDGDGFTNGSEFAFGGNPTAGSASLANARPSVTNMEVSFLAATNGVSYVVKTTTNLASGPWTNAAVTISNAPDQGGTIPTNYVRRQFSVPIGTNGFYRIDASY